MKGHIRKRGKGSWAVVIDLGRDSSGKRRQKWHTVHGTKTDAQRELTRILHQLDTGMYVRPSRMTVAEYLEQWLRDYAEPRVSAKTMERYREIAREHLIPNLGHFVLSREILSNVVDRGLIKRQPFDPFSLGQFPAYHL